MNRFWIVLGLLIACNGEKEEDELHQQIDFIRGDPFGTIILLLGRT